MKNLSQATGRRKEAVARVAIREGDGRRLVNGKPFKEYFQRESTVIHAEEPLKVYPSVGSLFLWVEVPEGDTDVSYAEKLLDAGIVVAPGSMFGGQEGYFRVALSPDLESCRAVAEVWPTG